MRKGSLLTCLVLVFFVSLCGFTMVSAADDNGVRPGKFIVEPPTLINLGFEWYVDGDANHNAVVKVSYRRKGDNAWKDALPLLRIQNEESIFAFAGAPNGFFVQPKYGNTNNRIDYVEIDGVKFVYMGNQSLNYIRKRKF